jgi:hypothetical protein
VEETGTLFDDAGREVEGMTSTPSRVSVVGLLVGTYPGTYPGSATDSVSGTEAVAVLGTTRVAGTANVNEPGPIPATAGIVIGIDESSSVNLLDGGLKVGSISWQISSSFMQSSDGLPDTH